MGLVALLVSARADDAPGLALDVGEFAAVVDDDVSGLGGALGVPTMRLVKMTLLH